MHMYSKMIVALSFALFAFHGNSQVSKADFQQFIASHAPASGQRFFVTRKVEYSPAANDFARSEILFDPATTTVTFSDNSVRIKDGKGMDMVLPYASVKFMYFQPESEKYYSGICIQVE